ncbi:tubulin-tyrosine ligase [Obba rivulosa]|uniref:Tubulin-tyrosine ligase n=1 Tax=Obba rivulosa TaxID=1052685 RepID=A0A8E2DV99_9APHY|nr:tubulin-tyrosine ligase [Obba rivulosa]
MEQFTALVTWPDAPLTDSLVRDSLASLHPSPVIVTSLSEELTASPGNLLQWSNYDAIDHELTHAPPPGSKVLSSSYTIRKALIRKHYLSRCFHNYLTKHPDSPLSRAAPKTWELDISFADELDEMWSDDLWDLGEELDKDGSDKWWLLKPGMTERGMGIRLFRTKDELARIFESFEQDDDAEEGEDGDDQQQNDTSVATSQLRHFVIQEYLSQPLLLDPSEVPLKGQQKPASPQDLRGHKFHLRVYCVASGALTIYMYTRMLALFSATPYVALTADRDGGDDFDVNEDLAAHLTNTSLQTERGEAGVRLFDELIGCHVLSPSPATADEHSAQAAHSKPQPQVSRAMGEALDADAVPAARNEEAEGKHNFQEESVLSTEDVEDIKSQIAEVLAETFKAALDMSVHFQPLPNAFEFYGIDFLVSHSETSGARRYQVHLLEVNSEPAIELTGPRLTWILEDVFRAMGKVCVEPFFRNTGEAETEALGEAWEVGQTRHELRKCLEMQVRGLRGW